MKRNLHLLVIDPQNDFCDLPENYLPVDPVTGDRIAPALPVAGAHADMLRLADLINRGAAGLAGISVTLDSHHRLDVAHPTFWMDGQQRPVNPFTQITAADVRAGKYQPRNPAALPRVLAYLDTLEAAGRYTLMVWPVHCEMGTWGHNVHADVRAAYNRWEDSALGIVNKVSKGTNPWTEHYSAIQAEVPDEEDDSTQLNRGFIDLLAKADRIYITGEAGSHCVKATTEHIVANFAQQDLAKLVLVTDCMSAVTGFDAQYQGFVQDMAARGVQIARAADVLPELLANAGR
ncbi:nicotinamidase-related amidase [Paucimonas lemoignei]|uniref:Nicotinamidase-related amidase n=1 Tax=Paucimonas lemoignei TaxID=29443 RepID=A0A4R3HSJ7_PAULE|nr:cysteine hydrolase [Paucimonas lemoignei]TCS35634.1 nicotinamidase-related amidase [Paucimonas lemoignei]